MYGRSAMLVPLFKTCLRQPVRVQTRNLWALSKMFDSIYHDMERQMERIERSLFRDSPLRIITPRYLPIEGKVANQDSSYRVNIDVRGFKPEDIKISLKQGVLKIEACMDKTSEDGSWFQQSIVREFTLPDNVEQSSVKSLFHEDGILSIEAALNKQSQPKDIPIQHLTDSSDTPKSTDSSDTPKSKM